MYEKCFHHSYSSSTCSVMFYEGGGGRIEAAEEIDA